MPMDHPVNPAGGRPVLGARTALPPTLDARSSAVLREIVEQYVHDGKRHAVVHGFTTDIAPDPL